MCSRCEALEARVEALEHALADAIPFFGGDQSGYLSSKLCLSPIMAGIVLLLYRAKRPLTRGEIDAALPPHYHNHSRKDPEFRTIGTIGVQIYYIRQRLGKDFIATQYRAGVSLSDKGREIVHRALAA